MPLPAELFVCWRHVTHVGQIAEAHQHCLQFTYERLDQHEQVEVLRVLELVSLVRILHQRVLALLELHEANVFTHEDALVGALQKGPPVVFAVQGKVEEVAEVEAQLPLDLAPLSLQLRDHLQNVLDTDVVDVDWIDLADEFTLYLVLHVLLEDVAFLRPVAHRKPVDLEDEPLHFPQYPVVGVRRGHRTKHVQVNCLHIVHVVTDESTRLPLFFFVRRARTLDFVCPYGRLLGTPASVAYARTALASPYRGLTL